MTRNSRNLESLERNSVVQSVRASDAGIDTRWQLWLSVIGVLQCAAEAPGIAVESEFAEDAVRAEFCAVQSIHVILSVPD